MRRTLLATGTVALAGCGLVPEEPDPIEASATTPAVLPADAGSEVTADETTVEVTIDVDLTGDVEISSSRDVTATVLRRVYEIDGGRFGLVTAPAVQVFERPEVVRDPVASVDAPRTAALATDISVDRVGSPDESGSVTMLGTEVPLTAGTAMAGDGDAPLARTRVRTGEDSVTAIAIGPTASDVPFGAVTRDG